jgi:hypothetical protein
MILQHCNGFDLIDSLPTAKECRWHVGWQQKSPQGARSSCWLAGWLLLLPLLLLLLRLLPLLLLLLHLLPSSLAASAARRWNL